jgi:hypothetical protein
VMPTRRELMNWERFTFFRIVRDFQIFLEE